MLPPALGGLHFHFRVPPVPGHPAPGSMEKIKLSRGHPQDTEIIPHRHCKWQARDFENYLTVRFMHGHVSRAAKPPDIPGEPPESPYHFMITFTLKNRSSSQASCQSSSRFDKITDPWTLYSTRLRVFVLFHEITGRPYSSKLI